VTLDGLQDLGLTEGLQDFAGTATYRAEFFSTGSAATRFLDLGKVHGVSEVVLNGSPLGCRWYGRHNFLLVEGLRSGRNSVEIRVTTVLGNYCKSLKDNGALQRWVRGIPAQPMGLLGPVRLLSVDSTA
jgi:hypothetical protein